MLRHFRALEAKKLYEQGMEVKEIAEKLGVVSGTISQDLRRLGVANRRKIKINSCKDTIIAMYKNGASFKEIGEAVGYSGTRVREYLVAWGYYDVFIPPEVEIDENTIFAEERPKVIPCVIYGKKYLDVTEVFCPR